MKLSRLVFACITATFMPALVAVGDQVPASIAEAVAGLTAYEAPAFPSSLRATSIRQGSATIVFTVAATGHIDDALMLQASDPAFGEAVLQVLPAWQATPQSDQTYPRREIIQFNFSRNGMVNSESSLEATKAAFPQAVAHQSVLLQQLDAPPKRLVAVMPKVAKTLLAQLDEAVRAKPVVVRFVVDAQGHVRVPVVTAATDRHIADAVLAAVKQWRYSPPLYHDQPVAVETSYAFMLSPAAQ